MQWCHLLGTPIICWHCHLDRKSVIHLTFRNTVISIFSCAASLWCPYITTNCSVICHKNDMCKPQCWDTLWPFTLQCHKAVLLHYTELFLIKLLYCESRVQNRVNYIWYQHLREDFTKQMQQLLWEHVCRDLSNKSFININI